VTDKRLDDGTGDVFAGLKAQLIEDCTDAVARRAPGPDGRVASEPRPDGCELLTDEEYLDAYLAGIRRSNEAARNAIWMQAADGPE
jgi:hypothetical protein